MTQKISLDEDIIRGVLEGSEKDRQYLREILGEDYIISQQTIDEAYVYMEPDSLDRIKKLFEINDRHFIEFLYYAYRDNKNLFLKRRGTTINEIVTEIKVRYEFMKVHIAREEFLDLIDKKKVKTDEQNCYHIKNANNWLCGYITKPSYDRQCVEVFLEMLDCAKRHHISDYVLKPFVELKPFNEDLYYFYPLIGEFSNRFIKLYFSKKKMFNTIFDIFAYLANTTYPKNCSLDRYSIGELELGTRLENTLLMPVNGIKSLEELKKKIEKDEIWGLEGVGDVNVEIIIDKFTEFLIKNRKFS